MKIDTRNIINVTQASTRGASWLVSRAEAGETLLIMKNSEPAAVVTSVDNVTRLEELDEVASDLRLLAATLARVVADTGDRYDLDEVIEELGIELDD